MGKVVERIRLQNFSDPDRSLEVDATVDTGATILALPIELIEQLGLQKFKDVQVRYADHRTATRSVYGVVTLEIQGRVGHFDVLAEGRGTEPLIGQTVLQELDLVVNPKSRTVVPNPDSPDLPTLDMLGFALGHSSPGSSSSGSGSRIHTTTEPSTPVSSRRRS